MVTIDVNIDIKSVRRIHFDMTLQDYEVETFTVELPEYMYQDMIVIQDRYNDFIRSIKDQLQEYFDPKYIDAITD